MCAEVLSIERGIFTHLICIFEKDLNWVGVKTKLVNVGGLRRAYRNSELLGSVDSSTYTSDQNAGSGVQQPTSGVEGGDMKGSASRESPAVGIAALGDRKILAQSLCLSSSLSCESYQFFDSKNVQFQNLRNMLATAALHECLGWLEGGGMAAIHDATNSNIARRKELIDHIRSVSKDIDVLFVGML